MTFTADQYTQIAQGYDKAAADPLVAPEQKGEFARKAEWFHFLARRERETSRSGGAAEGNFGPGRDIVIEPDSSKPNRRSIVPFLTTLWLTGAVLYFLSALLFTSAINLFGDEDGQTAVTEASQPVKPLPKVAKVEDKKASLQGDQQFKLAADRRHAISPDQPAYEAPDLKVPPSLLPEQKPDSPPPPPESVQDDAGGQSAEVLTATAVATIRSGPSTTAKKIGTATPGAQLQVKARETGWVQFVDPSSGNTGWIHSSLVAPASEAGTDGLATTQEAEIPSVETPKPKLANKRAKQKPRAPVQVTTQQRKYVDLPDDEQFLSPRRRVPGFLAKRRMLRQGLMSPGFLPPQ
jgi:uncharacterized protein YraI